MTPQQKYLDIVDEVIAKGPFKPDWVSLSDYETPKWLKNGKFGIFIHWGLFSVPAFNNEWYSRNMYIQRYLWRAYQVWLQGLYSDVYGTKVSAGGVGEAV